MKQKHVQNLFSRFILRLFFVAMAFLPTLAQAQYFEGFSGQAGKGVIGGGCSGADVGTCANLDLEGVDWTLSGNFSGMDSNDDAGVVNGLFGNQLFKISDTDGEVCWVSPELDISNADGDVSITVVVLAELGSLEDSDYVEAEYSLDGGPFTSFGFAQNDFGIDLFFSVTGLSGSTLVIRVCGATNDNNESIFFDGIWVPTEGVVINDCANDEQDPEALCQNATVELDENGEGFLSVEDIDYGSNDNCTIEGLELSQTEFSCEDAGEVEVTLTVTDEAGNSASCSATVTVEDHIATEITCNDITVTFNGEGSIHLDPESMAEASDNCVVESLLAEPAYIHCSELGELVQVTLTATDAGGNPSSCTSTVTVEGLPCGWMQMPNGVACTEGNDAAYDVPEATFSLTADGCYTTSTTADESGYIKYALCGDGSITAHIASLTLPGFAGIVMRESDAAGAKKVAMVYQGGNAIARYVRYTTGGISTPSYIPSAPGTTWLRIVRTGNTFQGYRSTNGVNWLYSFTVTVPMSSCIQIGLTASGTNATSVETAEFDHVTVTPAYGEHGNRTVLEPDFTTETAGQLSIWPNPAADQSVLSLNESWGQNVTVAVLDGFGRQVKTLQADATAERDIRLEMGDQAQGVYLVKVSNRDGRTATTRLVVVRE